MIIRFFINQCGAISFFAGLLVSLSAGQIQIENDSEDDNFVIEIDTAQSANVGKSLGAALGLSALLPGGGEFYLKEKKQAKVFWLVETGFWSALAVALMAKQSYLTSAKHYASYYADLDPEGKDAAFLSDVTQYRSYTEQHHRKDSYEQLQILAGERKGDYEIEPDPNNHWDFGSAAIDENTRNWQKFEDATKAYGWAEVAVNWAVGGLILSRVVSLVNTLHLYKKTSVKGLTDKAPSTPNDLASRNSIQKRFNYNLVSITTPGRLGALLTVRF